MNYETGGSQMDIALPWTWTYEGCHKIAIKDANENIIAVCGTDNVGQNEINATRIVQLVNAVDKNALLTLIEAAKDSLSIATTETWKKEVQAAIDRTYTGYLGDA